MSFLMHCRFAGGIIKANITKKWFPLTVSLTVTNRCNLQCVYCYGNYHQREIEDFPTKFWLDLIDELHSLGTKLVHLEGGEPLLRQDIGTIINHVKKKGMLCRMNSNGYLVPKRVQDIKILDSLCISLDGDEESNDKNRGEGCYKKALDALRAAKKNRIPVLSSTVITQNNVGDRPIEHVLSLAKEIGFGAQFNFLYEQTTDNTDDPACRVQEEAIKKAIIKLIEYKKKGWPIFYSMATYNNALHWPASYEVRKFTSKKPGPSEFSHIPCYMGKLMCFVDGDGKVYPCGEHIGKFPALSIQDVGFKKAWENVAKKKDCYACWNTCFDEYNEVFNCKPGVWWNNFKNNFKNRSR